MKFSTYLQPRYNISIAVTVAAVMVISAVIELNQSKTEIFDMLREQAYSLSETVNQSSLNNLLSTQEIEKTLTERLLNNAYFIARLDSEGTLTRKQLNDIATSNNIFRINIFNRQGLRILGSHPSLTEHADLAEKHSPKDFIQPILNNDTVCVIIGLKEARFEKGQRYAIAIKRTNLSGGAIVLNIDAAELLSFRKSIGIGKLIQDIGDNGGIEYIALQDSLGIIAASGAVNELSSIESDSMLLSSLSSKSTVTRIQNFHEREVFEIIKPFIFEKSTLGIFRIGLNMDAARATKARMERRIIIMSIVLGVIGIFIVTIIVGNQNFQLIRQKYKSISTFTGNILSQMQDAVITIDTTGTVTLFNKRAETLFGVDGNTVVGNKLSGLSLGISNCLQKIFSTAESHTEQSIDCGSGLEHIVSISLTKVQSPNGEMESITAVIKDMTNARQLERELQRKDKLTAMGELASGVAHEIRNPINAISMIAQRFEKEFRPKADEQEYYELTSVIKSETRRINNIIKQFLNFARPPKLNIERINPGHYFQHVSTLFAGQASAKGVRFNTDLQCTKDFSIDREQFTQAILNLLQNALDVTSAGGTISLSCIDDENEIRITVSDTGKGISKEELEKIFNLYYTTKHDGTGMGLAITQQIITQHNGNIVVQSEIGKGSKFTIILPSIV